MNSKRIIKGKLFLAALVTMLCGMVAGGCSDDKDELAGKQYGHVQFRLYKSASYTQEETTRAGTASTRATAMDRLSDAQKVEIEMQHNGMSITQTLVLNAYNESNAEYGMRSDKLELLTGTYKIVGYKLLDKLDEVITGISPGADETFEVVSRGLTTKDLVADSQARGMVTFKLIKSGLTTRAADGESIDYLFSDIKVIDVTVTNTFTRVPVTIKNLKVTYKEEYEEHPNADYTDDNKHKDKYKDIGTAKCDSAVWLPAGTYQVTSYTIYKKSGSVTSTLDSRSQLAGEMFSVEDNRQTDDALVPIQLSPAAAYIKDYIALKAIWEALDGKNWSFTGETSPAGVTWNSAMLLLLQSLQNVVEGVDLLPAQALRLHRGVCEHAHALPADTPEEAAGLAHHRGPALHRRGVPLGPLPLPAGEQPLFGHPLEHGGGGALGPPLTPGQGVGQLGHSLGGRLPEAVQHRPLGSRQAHQFSVHFITSIW